MFLNRDEGLSATSALSLLVLFESRHELLTTELEIVVVGEGDYGCRGRACREGEGQYCRGEKTMAVGKERLWAIVGNGKQVGGR